MLNLQCNVNPKDASITVRRITGVTDHARTRHQHEMWQCPQSTFTQGDVAADSREGRGRARAEMAAEQGPSGVARGKRAR